MLNDEHFGSKTDPANFRFNASDPYQTVPTTNLEDNFTDINSSPDTNIKPEDTNAADDFASVFYENKTGLGFDGGRKSVINFGGENIVQTYGLHGCRWVWVKAFIQWKRNAVRNRVADKIDNINVSNRDADETYSSSVLGEDDASKIDPALHSKYSQEVFNDEASDSDDDEVMEDTKRNMDSKYAATNEDDRMNMLRARFKARTNSLFSNLPELLQLSKFSYTPIHNKDVKNVCGLRRQSSVNGPTSQPCQKLALSPSRSRTDSSNAVNGSRERVARKSSCHGQRRNSLLDFLILTRHAFTELLPTVYFPTMVSQPFPSKLWKNLDRS